MIAVARQRPTMQRNLTSAIGYTDISARRDQMAWEFSGGLDVIHRFRLDHFIESMRRPHCERNRRQKQGQNTAFCGGGRPTADFG